MNSKRYFNKVANQWDSMRKDFFSESVRDKALTVAAVRSGQIAVDMGAGTGFMTEALIHRGLDVIAVDQSETMLDMLRNKFGGSKKIECYLGNAQNLSLKDGLADYVFANMYLHHADNPPQAIQEMARVLKIGGKLVITDLDDHQFDFLRKEHCDKWMGFKRQDIKRWFSDAALGDVRIDCLGENCCAQSVCGTDKAEISIFVALGRKS